MLLSNRGKGVSITVTIFIIFSFLLILMASIIIGLTYVRNYRSAVITADKLMEKSSSQVYMKISNMFDPLFFLSEQVSSIPSIGEKPTIQYHPGEMFFLDTLDLYAQVQMLYLGFSDGDFYEIFSLAGEGGGAIGKSVLAPEEARYALVQQYESEGTGKTVRLWKFLNETRQIIGSRKEENVTYDPRERPWFENGIANSAGSTISYPYRFSTSGEWGVTISRRINGHIPSVLGLDIFVGEISRFFEEISRANKGLCFVVNGEGRLLYYPEALFSFRDNTSGSYYLEDSDIPGADLLLNRIQFMIGDESNFTLGSGKGSRIVKIKELDLASSMNEYMVFIIPRENILGEAAYTAELTALLSVFVVILGIPAAFLFSKMISRPISKLTREASLIKHFDLSGELVIRSRIREIRNLADEMSSMKMGLRYLNKYVPSKLVRELLESGSEAEIGGEIRDMSFLFSDIENFTAIAERSDPIALMNRLSEYLGAVSRVIRDYDGTVDKYIGDSVMAFWNAPLDDPDHASHACGAAIAVQSRIDVLNRKWAGEGLEPFITRIGLSSGEAVVGNIGSEDRMNYTVIGDQVNLSSRLEGINKIYNTRIIASSSLVKKLDASYLYRPLDKIIVKGKTEALMIYEIIGLAMGASIREKEFVRAFEEGFYCFFSKEWERAENCFSLFEKDRPHDTVLKDYLDKIRLYRYSPPEEDWNGIRKQATKL